MKAFLAQMVFAARNEDFEGWTRILIFVVVGVVYVVGGILKARAKKSEGAEGEKGQHPIRPRPAGSATRRLARPALDGAGPAVQPQGTKVVPARPAVQKLAAKVEQAIRIYAAEPPAKPKLSIPMPQLEAKIQELPEIKPEIEKLPDFISETVKGLEDKRARAAVPAETAEMTYLGEPLLDVSDPEELKRAILHYEILGKPLSLREPPERIIGL